MGRGLAAADGIRILRVGVESSVSGAHALHERERRHSRRRLARRCHAAGHLVRGRRRVKRREGRIEDVLHIEARRDRHRERPAVRLVPRRPHVHPGEAQSGRVREIPEPGRGQMREGAAAVCPARRAVERHERADALRMQGIEHVAVSPPVVRRRAARIRRLLRRDLIPAEREPHYTDTEVLERRQPLPQRPRPVHQPGVVLDPERRTVRRLSRQREDQRQRCEKCGSDPPEHVGTVAAGPPTSEVRA